MDLRKMEELLDKVFAYGPSRQEKKKVKPVSGAVDSTEDKPKKRRANASAPSAGVTKHGS